METLSPVRLLGSSWRAQRAETTWDAVSTQRTKGDTKTRWIGNPSWFRIFRPVQKARTRPSSTRGGSHGLSAVVTHNGSKLSLRSPCRITTTFWCCCCWWFSWDSEDGGSICCFFLEFLFIRQREREREREMGFDQLCFVEVYNVHFLGCV